MQITLVLIINIWKDYCLYWLTKRAAVTALVWLEGIFWAFLFQHPGVKYQQYVSRSVCTNAKKDRDLFFTTLNQGQKSVFRLVGKWHFFWAVDVLCKEGSSLIYKISRHFNPTWLIFIKFWFWTIILSIFDHRNFLSDTVKSWSPLIFFQSTFSLIYFELIWMLF